MSLLIHERSQRRQMTSRQIPTPTFLKMVQCESARYMFISSIAHLFIITHVLLTARYIVPPHVGEYRAHNVTQSFTVSISVSNKIGPSIESTFTNCKDDSMLIVKLKQYTTHSSKCTCLHPILYMMISHQFAKTCSS